MFVCRLEDKDLPALGGPAEKVCGRGGGAARAPGAAPAGPAGVGGPDRAGAGLLGVAGR